MTIPAVIVNTNQAEFKTGLRKAVSVLNSAITMNKALTGESPYDNGDLYNYLQQNMSVMKRVTINNNCPFGGYNSAFYTPDGMRFEIPNGKNEHNGYSRDFYRLYESSEIYAKSPEGGGKCGSLGLAHNPDGTTEPPCAIMVDVNGDRKPSPIYTYSSNDSDPNLIQLLEYNGDSDNNYKIADPNGRLLTDVFPILITDQGAIPYGVVAQKAMYQAQK